MFIVDAHLDLSMNALEWNRDLTQPVAAINQREFGLTDKPDRGKATVSLPELRKGNIGLIVATQIARHVAPDNKLPGWHSPEQAWAQTQGQLAWYKAMENAGEMVQINDLARLDEHLKLWANGNNNAAKPIGYILSLEGADSLVSVGQGTDATGFMGQKGHELLKEMERLNVILDATHLCDDSFWEALDNFNGHVWASHNNCRALVNHNRQYSDDQIKALIDRGAVIGAALDAWMMVPNWVRGESAPQGMNCNLEVMIDHIDHICQIAGNTLHVGMGTDLDGAFGREQCPYDLEAIADLQKLTGLLAKRGYTNADIESMMHGNWLRFLKKAWA
jgi:membrane dipeptidase